MCPPPPKQDRVKIITTRSFKKFDKEEFLKDIKQRQWDEISLYFDPNEMVVLEKSVFELYRETRPSKDEKNDREQEVSLDYI